MRQQALLGFIVRSSSGENVDTPGTFVYDFIGEA
jgi:hypothetical protein